MKDISIKGFNLKILYYDSGSLEKNTQKLINSENFLFIPKDTVEENIDLVEIKDHELRRFNNICLKTVKRWENGNYTDENLKILLNENLEIVYDLLKENYIFESSELYKCGYDFEYLSKEDPIILTNNLEMYKVLN